MGFIFQAFYLQPFLSLQQNVEVPMMFGSESPEARAAAAATAIEAVGLKDRLSHKPSELSGGQQQRVAIARAVAHEPKILFADEPTGNLDKNTTADVLSLLQNLNRDRGMTLVLVTHDENVAATANRIIRLEDGEVVA
ncbi:MAG: ATP-binding cassette domain-containing protein, partial [Candidatus Andersenbacteria bacterium]|nr:ATP-binding cassette domain-containing protein [Candidatus Andersenbacteria bacterium]